MKKQIYNLFKLFSVTIVSAIFLLPSAASAEAPARTDSVDFFLNVRAGMCDVSNPAVGVITGSAPDDALVYGAPPDRGCVPVNAPDGHQLTLGEFKSVKGDASVQCINKGSLVVVHLSGLIPKGVYTAWLPILVGNTFPPPSAATALGSVVGDDTFANTFVASASGEGQIALIQPAGIGTFVPGDIPQCLLDRNFEVHIAYHINGETNGGVPGPPTTWVVQEAFQFHP